MVLGFFFFYFTIFPWPPKFLERREQFGLFEFFASPLSFKNPAYKAVEIMDI